MTTNIARRTALKQMGAALAVGAIAGSAPAADKRPAGEPFGYCLNTGTIRGQKLGIVKEVEIAAKAGYKAIEPWIGTIRNYQKKGGSLKDLRKRIADLGLSVPSAIGFASWISDNDARRAKGLEDLARDMDLVKQIGGTGLAASPAGVGRTPIKDLFAIAKRYRAVLDLGDKTGVAPLLEIWGPSNTLSRIGQALFVAAESGHSKASVLLDVYHIYKGGSGFSGLKFLGPDAMHVFHVNDYPADPPRKTISDADRVFPGDGVAPLKQIFSTLKTGGFHGWLSLELFNREYYKRPAMEVAKEGLAKTRAAVQKALA
jgi:sugar phosphate isomerase/epimerase